MPVSLAAAWPAEQTYGIASKARLEVEAINTVVQPRMSARHHGLSGK